MKTSLIVVLATFLLFSSPVLADLTSAVGSATDAATSRSMVLDENSSPSKPEKKERKFLKKVLKILANYVGEDDKPDLKTVKKAILKLLKSKSTDPAIAGCLDALQLALADLAADIRKQGVDTLVCVEVEKWRKKVQKHLDSGSGHLSAGVVRWETNRKAGAKKLVKACLTFLKAFGLAENHAEEECGTTAPDVFLTGTSIYNGSAHDIAVNDLVLDLTGTVGGEPYTLKGSAAGMVGGGFPYTVPAGAILDFFIIVMAIVAADPEPGSWQLGDTLTGTVLVKTSVGDLLYDPYGLTK